jgi:tripartite-type tricarboxylate transporter receptor subunit TctC
MAPIARAARLFAFACAALAAASATSAHSADFYAGKQIRLAVSTAPGGGYDTYARALAPFLARHIPGQPSIIVENMPGASGVKVASFLSTVAPRDGTVIGGTHSEAIVAPLTMPNAARYDANAFSWLGSLTSDPFIGYVWHTTPIYKFEDLRDHEIIMGATSAGDPSINFAHLAKALFGLKLKIVSGYNSSVDLRLAMARGETQGAFAHTWGSIKSGISDWLRDGKVRLIIQHGIRRLPELAELPLFGDFAQTDDERQMIAFMVSRAEAAKPYLAPPGIPAERLDILRRAFDAAVADPGFREVAAKTRLSLDNPMTGEQLGEFVAKISQTPPELIDRINKTMAAGAK